MGFDGDLDDWHFDENVIEKNVGVKSVKSMEEELINEEDPMEHDSEEEPDILESNEDSDDEGNGNSNGGSSEPVMFCD